MTSKTKLIHGELGSLSQISEMLLSEMRKEIERNGCSDLTLNMEGAWYGISEIIELNGIKEYSKEDE